MKKLIKYLFIFIALFTINFNVYAEDETLENEETKIEETEKIDEEETTNEEENDESEEQETEEQEEVTDNNTIPEDKISVHEEMNGYKIIIEDEANLLSNEEIEKLKDKMSSLTKYGHAAFVTTDNNLVSTEMFAKDYYGRNFNEENGTVVVIDMSNRMIYIASNGYNKTIITNGKSDIITDNSYQYATNKQYYECAYKMFDQIYTLLDGGKILEPMRHVSNIFVAILSAFFINFMIVISATKIKKEKDSEILKNCNISCTASDISGVKTGTRRVYNPPSSSSGGGGGGGGGGSSCSGGGHSF